MTRGAAPEINVTLSLCPEGLHFVCSSLFRYCTIKSDSTDSGNFNDVGILKTMYTFFPSAMQETTHIHRSLNMNGSTQTSAKDTFYGSAKSQMAGKR